MVQRKEAELPIQLIRRKMIVTSTVVVVIIGLISGFVIWMYGYEVYGGAYVLGALLGIVNGALGFVTIEKFIDRSTIVFLKGVFIGMGVRLALLLGVFILLMLVFRVPVAPLVTGLLIFYFAMSVLEVIFLNKRVSLRKTTKVSAQ